MTAAIAPSFTAARVQGRYRVLDEAGQIVVTLNSKAKAEARAAELNAAATTVAEADNMAEIDAALAVLDTATAEVEQAQEEEPVIVRAGEIAPLVQDEPMQEAPLLDTHEQMERSLAIARAAAEEERRDAAVQAELDAQAAARAAEGSQEEPAGDAGTSDTPAAPAKAEKPAKAVKPAKKPAAPKADQPAPHAFTTVGTTVKNHCTECGRSWAAASHRKFREAQAETVEATEEWTPAEDDTTDSGKAPAEEAQAAAV
jgi:hypothetical protein